MDLRNCDDIMGYPKRCQAPDDNRKKIAKEAFDISMELLCVRYPHLRVLLYGFEVCISHETETIGTDGRTLYISPDWLLDHFQNAPEDIEYQLLHALGHTLLLHVLQERDDMLDRIYDAEADEFANAIMKQSKKVPGTCDDHTFWKYANREELLDRMDEQTRYLRKQTGAGQGGASDTAGSEGGTASEKVRLQQKHTYDFRTFLSQFAVEQEEVQLDPESFDYIPYLYGMGHYGNMPLIEHLEYQDIHRLEELVIAIDTSGSCSEETVCKFLEEAYGILTDRRNFFRKMNVYIIQCDCFIQNVAHITDEGAWHHYVDNLEIHGRSGTDFRPVFDYVEQLRQEKRLRNLKGLLYFTDGDGIYPEKPTDYLTAFVLYHEKERHDKIPEWCQALYLEDEDNDR